MFSRKLSELNEWENRNITKKKNRIEIEIEIVNDVDDRDDWK